jgi:predicted RNase H-like nuclease
MGTTFNGLGERLVDRRMMFSGKDLAADDVLDAYALTWTALRIATGEARRLPSDPPRDRKGLRMEVWY